MNTQCLLFVLEMRIMGDSNIILAPQRGNKHGTVTIEILSWKLCDEQVWENFMSKVSSKLLSYKDCNNIRLNSRFHWAKQIPKQCAVNGEEATGHQYNRQVHALALEEFCQVLDDIAPGGRFEALQLFGNETLNDLFQHQLVKAT